MTDATMIETENETTTETTMDLDPATWVARMQALTPEQARQREDQQRAVATRAEATAEDYLRLDNLETERLLREAMQTLEQAQDVLAKRAGVMPVEDEVHLRAQAAALQDAMTRRAARSLARLWLCRFLDQAIAAHETPRPADRLTD